MKKYKHFFFDLDHTLWDFEKNSKQALGELYDDYELKKFELFSKEDFLKTFDKVNMRLWHRYSNGHITSKKLREERFDLVFYELKLPVRFIPKDMSEVYLITSPKKSNVFPFTHETLDYLQKHYNLHIITNGFDGVQEIKMQSAALSKYFDKIVTSETTKHKKPQREIFEHALEISNAKAEDSIMVGDNLKADIIGARNAGIDQVFFNPDKNFHTESVTFEISCLSEMQKLF